MALVDITIDFDLAQLLGADFDPRRTKAYVTTNVESGTLMDTSTGETRLGDEAVTINSDGTGSFTTWATGADGNPISWQTSLVIDYPRTGQRDRKRRVFGPWTLTTADDGKNITALEDEQAVPPEYLTTVTTALQTYVDAGQAAATTASAAATTASGAADTAVNAAGLATEIAMGDGGAALAAADLDPGSAFRLQNDPRMAATYALKPTNGARAVGKGELVFDIRDYGAAVGNTAAANQTAIQNALTAAGVAGGTVYVPPGTFLHSDAFTVPSNVHLRGSGIFSALKATSLVNGGTGIGHRQLDATSKTGFRISDLMLDASEMTVFTSGMRSILCQTSTNYSIDRVYFRTPGAAVASIGCSSYTIDRPHAEIIATDGVAHHDGIIDQWAGSHDFTILHPVIKGNGIGKYGVLVTGEDTAGLPAACYDFTIVKPRVYSVKQAGVLSNGREGVNHDFTIDQPYVNGVELYHGVGIADSTDWTLIAPRTNNTGANGVRVYSETAEGGVTGGRNGVVIAPVVKNANLAASASGTDGAAIAVTNNSDGVVVVSPRVSGTGHTYALTFGTSTTNATYVEGRLAAGTLGKVSGDPNGGTYTPVTTAVANVTAVSAATCRWSRRGDVLTVHGRISVTPTAGGSAVTTVGIALPVASNLASATNDLSGSGSTKTGVSCGISADITNDRAELEFLSPGTTALLLPFSFSYTVL